MEINEVQNGESLLVNAILMCEFGMSYYLVVKGYSFKAGSDFTYNYTRQHNKLQSYTLERIPNHSKVWGNSFPSIYPLQALIITAIEGGIICRIKNPSPENSFQIWCKRFEFYKKYELKQDIEYYPLFAFAVKYWNHEKSVSDVVTKEYLEKILTFLLDHEDWNLERLKSTLFELRKYQFTFIDLMKNKIDTLIKNGKLPANLMIL